IAEKFENCPVESIAPGFRNHTDVGSPIAPIGRIIECCLDLELLYAVRVGSGNSAAPSCTPLYVADANSLQLKVIVIRGGSVDVDPIVRLGNLRQSGPTQS